MKWCLYAAWLIALAGVLASFYYSEIVLIEPCRLCWYQRAALMPLAIQLGMAVYRFDVKYNLYAYPLCALGAAAALFQVIQSSLGLRLCGPEGCSGSPHVFGLVPLPWVSAAMFAAIGALLFLSSRTTRRAR